SYSSKNPFKTPKQAAPAQQTAPAGGTPASGGSGAGSGPSGGGGPTGGSLPGLGTPSLGGGTPPAPVPVEPVKPKTETFTYTVDVRMGKRGEAKARHDVERLDVLPDDRRPLIVFLGVNNARTTAIFLVDTSVQADGEGRCKPDPTTCSFLYLKTDKDHNEEEFIQADPATGTATAEWTLKLLSINRVSLSELQKKKPSAAQARRAIKRAKALRKREAVPFHFLFELPSFADEQQAPAATTGS
ncbi:MAG TPA: hypothetical protein VFQ22_14600, partial [Longimicrobiales bacterium]|nr:hypothetical protein [Longimicrobiales bacterium]